MGEVMSARFVQTPDWIRNVIEILNRKVKPISCLLSFSGLLRLDNPGACQRATVSTAEDRTNSFLFYLSLQVKRNR
jgi:hypothetical protein